MAANPCIAIWCSSIFTDTMRSNPDPIIESRSYGVTFYKTRDGYLAKEKSSISAEKIKSDPRFARTRENGREFMAAAKSGKLLRDSLRTMMMTASDPRITSRLTQLMMKICKEDTVSMRGSRHPTNGVETTNGKELLKSFNFNIDSILGSTLFKPYTVNTTTGEISIADFSPITDIAAPEGATHFSLIGGMLVIDFSGRTFNLKLTNIINSSITATTLAVSLIPTSLPTGTGTKLFLLKMDFFQLVNGMQYPLRNGAFNALELVEMA